MPPPSPSNIVVSTPSPFPKPGSVSDQAKWAAWDIFWTIFLVALVLGGTALAIFWQP
jgi:hypothetical protein